MKKKNNNDQFIRSPRKSPDALKDVTGSPDESDHSIVSAHDSSVGSIGFDDLGQPRWTWITELDDSNELAHEDTFDYLKALDNETLELADSSGAQPTLGEGSPKSGYDPYDTARINMKGRFGRRR